MRRLILVVLVAAALVVTLSACLPPGVHQGPGGTYCYDYQFPYCNRWYR